MIISPKTFLRESSLKYSFNCSLFNRRSRAIGQYKSLHKHKYSLNHGTLGCCTFQPEHWPK